jgi:uncharacterized protein (TIRG00374 family)
MLPGLLVSLALIGAIAYFVDFNEVYNALRAADFTLLAVVFGLGLLWLLMRAVVWRTLLRERAPYGKVFLTIMEGYLLNNFLPFRLGEVGRAFLLSRKSDLKFGEILPTIIIERITDLAFSAAIFLAAIPFVVGAEGADSAAWAVGAAVILGLAAMFWLAHHRPWAQGVFTNISARLPFLARFADFFSALLDGLAVLTDPWLSARFLGWMTLNWGLAIVQYYLLSLAFFPQAQPVWGMFVLGAAAFGGAIPSLPGGVGTMEGAFGAALTLLSGDQSTALAVALSSRALNYTYSLTFGLYGISREGQTLSQLYADLTGGKVGAGNKE